MATTPAPVITSHSIGSGTVGINDDSGDFHDVTADNSVTLKGTAVAGSTVTIFDGTTDLGTTVTNSAGAWSYVTGPLSDGSNDLTATATDASGTSPASSVLDVSINSDVTITSNADQYDNNTWQYAADNGVWNAGNMVNGTNFTVSLTLDPATFPNGVDFSWSFPVRSYWDWDVVAFPNVKYDPHTASGQQIFTQIANFTNLTANYSIKLSGLSVQTDVAFDLYFESSPSFGKNLAEVEVVVHSPWTGFGSNEPYSITVPGLTDAKVHYSPSTIPLILVTTPTDVLSDSISLSDVLKTLVWQGLLNANDYIGASALGSEVAGGAGGFDINNLSYTWTANPSLTLAAGNDTLVINSMGGNHVIGNGAVDTVVYSGSYSNYQIESSGSEILITEGNNIATMDELQGISLIKFSNGTYNIATASFVPSVGSQTVIQTDAGTSLTAIGNDYYLYNSAGSGPALQVHGYDVTAGLYRGWMPIGAVETATGYDIAWKNSSLNEYTIWKTDSNGNYISNLIGDVSGNTAALESFEPIFYQDLNGDGYIGSPTTVINVSGDVLLTLNPLQQAATIDAGATLELAGADTGSVTFEESTGALILDHSSTFSGKIFDFTGNGSLSGSDQIDLKDVKYNSVKDSYADGVLTVTDGVDTAKLDFSGSYTLANFDLASDGHGGTIVYDPPVPASDTRGPSVSQNTATNEPQSGTVSLPDNARGPNIALLGNYIAASFAMANEGHDGGPIIAAEASQPNSQVLLSMPHHA